MTNLNDLNQNKSILIKGKLIDFDQPKIMGILNVTPDSFFKESRIKNIDDLLFQAKNMIENGADILDLGAISTRPGASTVEVTEEIKRIQLPLKIVRKEFPEIILSLDTYNSQTAQFGLENGIDMINDVSGGQIDDRLLDTVSQFKVPYVLTHGFGMADLKSGNETKENIIQELINYFSRKLNVLLNKGITDIIIDPGFGFGKTMDENFEIISNFDALKILEKPILVGISRKSMIYKKLQTTPDDSLNGTIALNSILMLKGSSIFRVHDVLQMKQIKILCQSI
ncbi:MAG: dihydropteroate synthase [Bacteroidetes bacterium]|nr:dihydropteroate synthase [Bacteroidota bacterium]